MIIATEASLVPQEENDRCNSPVRLFMRFFSLFQARGRLDLFVVHRRKDRSHERLPLLPMTKAGRGYGVSAGPKFYADLVRAFAVHPFELELAGRMTSPRLTGGPKAEGTVGCIAALHYRRGYPAIKRL